MTCVSISFMGSGLGSFFSYCGDGTVHRKNYIQQDGFTRCKAIFCSGTRFHGPPFIYIFQFLRIRTKAEK